MKAIVYAGIQRAQGLMQPSGKMSRSSKFQITGKGMQFHQLDIGVLYHSVRLSSTKRGASADNVARIVCISASIETLFSHRNADSLGLDLAAA